jgi:hypothetical protein
MHIFFIDLNCFQQLARLPLPKLNWRGRFIGKNRITS